MNATPQRSRDRILVVGRSPNVLLETVDILRGKGFAANATNQFDQVLDDYSPTTTDIVVFGGMVPAETTQYLRAEFAARNPDVTFVQGLAGIAGLVAIQAESAALACEAGDNHVSYDAAQRVVRLTLTGTARVLIQAWWHTSFTPPEPKSTSMQVLDSTLGTGNHIVPLPNNVPSEASFLTVAVDSAILALTVGAMPQRVTRMVPASSATSSPNSNAHPPVSIVNTGRHDR